MSEKYHIYSKLGLSSHAYNFASVHSIITKEDSDSAMEFSRTMQYDLTFNGYRGYMFAGIEAIYSWVMENIQTSEPYNESDLVRAYVIAVLDKNDLREQKIYYTVRFITAENESMLVESDAFKQLVHEYSLAHDYPQGSKVLSEALRNNVAIMNYGLITKNMMSKLNFDNILFTMSTGKTSNTAIKKISLKKDVGYSGGTDNLAKSINKYFTSNPLIDEYNVDLDYKYLKEEAQ